MNKLPKHDNFDDDEKNKKEIIPLLLPNCPDIKAFIKSIESPRVLLEFLKEDYETIYELANYGNEPPFSKLIHEAAGRIWEMGLKKSFKLPVEPVSNDMRVYKTWCRTCIDCINSIKNAESENDEKKKVGRPSKYTDDELKLMQKAYETEIENNPDSKAAWNTVAETFGKTSGEAVRKACQKPNRRLEKRTK